MPLTSNSSLNNIPETPLGVSVLNQENFARGVISLVDQSKLPKNALKEASNLTLAEDGAPTIRPGIAWYGTAPSNSVMDGGGMYVAADDTVHLLAIAGGQIFRSLNDGLTWTLCQTGSGATTVFTAGKKVRLEQANAFTYMFNGYDNIIRYDGSVTLQTYTALSTPVAISAVKSAGLAGTAVYTYRYRVAAVNDVGYTIASTAVTVTVDRARVQWDASNFVTFSWNAVTNAVRYDIYTGQAAGEEVYIDSTENGAATSYVDKGQAIEQVSVNAPESNTTQGPRSSDMVMVGSRLFATGDRDFPYRVWISGAGRYIGQFSSAYDATYIDLQKGSQFKPIKVVDYRKGNNDPVATVFCKSKDGKGCIWQGTLDAFTVGSITFPVPNFFKLPGSRGTDAPDSVVNVLNDYMYYNSQAIYNLGSRAQFLNLLSTDEVSANIRPDVKNINQAAAPGICSAFLDAKVYMSVPYGNSTTNSATIIFDTERKAWLPRGFTVGFERFFTYTDTSAVQGRHLMCWKPGDKQFSEINQSIKGDYGLPFETSLITGLIHINPKNRFEFLFVEEAEVEVAQPQGTITLELSGITRENGFESLKTRHIRPKSTSYSWTLGKWSKHKWTDTTTKAVSFSEPSTKRYFSVQREVNAYQYRMSTNTIDASFLARTLQINGTATQSGKPREWELFD